MGVYPQIPESVTALVQKNTDFISIPGINDTHTYSKSNAMSFGNLLDIVGGCGDT